jgi:PhzF family phenazine biosynthesis protein
VDVFADAPFAGNPLAVVFDADNLDTDRMQQITRWLNLSETVFFLKPTMPAADYRIRIFTLARELPFAGHPTLGACHAWLSAGGVPKAADAVVQECPAGLVPVRRDAGRLAFAAPPLVRSGPVEPSHLQQLAAVLRLSPADIVAAEWVDNGPGWVGVLLKDAAAVLAVDADASKFTGPGSFDVGLVGPHPPGSECAFEVRALFTDETGAIREDPVTGSLNASLAQWLTATGRATPTYVVSQGTRLGRRGRVFLSRDAAGAIWVGGHATTLFEGRGTW